MIKKTIYIAITGVVAIALLISGLEIFSYKCYNRIIKAITFLKSENAIDSLQDIHSLTAETTLSEWRCLYLHTNLFKNEIP